MTIEFIKVDLTDNWVHYETFYKTKKLPIQPAWKNRNSNEQYCLHINREKLTIIFLKTFRHKA